MTQFTEHVAFHSYQDFSKYKFLLIDAYSLLTWDRSPDVEFIYKIYLQAHIQVIHHRKNVLH